MADPQDLQVAVQVRSPHTGRPTVILWEPTPGGVGLAERLYRDFAGLVHMAVGWVRDCPCLDGCPSCVGPPVAGLGAKAPVQAALAHMEQAHAAIR
jgi:DEAD/DEAH box helicase domain-containing protein